MSGAEHAIAGRALLVLPFVWRPNFRLVIEVDHIQPPSTIHICAVQERLSSAASQRTRRATSAG
jgi:hypothetical protein